MSLEETVKPCIRYLVRFIICALACQIAWLVKIAIGSLKCRRELKGRSRKSSYWEHRTEELRGRPGRNVSGVRRLRSNRLCVLCLSNTLEIILLPCGHVCMCEDCSVHVTLTCPVCRSRIKRKHRAYVC